MKPKIAFEKGRWMLTYGFHPRQMWLFGANAEERRKITEACVHTSAFDTWANAVDALAYLYSRREIRL